MARPVWSGALSLGLVTVPVELYPAVADHTIHFHQFERGTSDRIRNRKVNERTGDEVTRDEIVKGYDVGGGDHVLVEPDELDEIAPERSRRIDIEQFVELDEIDPWFYDRTYWLKPHEGGFRQGVRPAAAGDGPQREGRLSRSSCCAARSTSARSARART